MKFQANREALHEAIANAARLISPRPQSPQLSGIMISAAGKEASFLVFDYETSGRFSAAAAVETEGRVLVAGRLLADIVSRLPDDTVNIELKEGKLLVKSGQSKFSLPVMTSSEFPETFNFPKANGTVEASLFSDAVSQVSVAAARDDVQAAFSTVVISATDNQLTLSATDRFRVATRVLPWKGTATDKEVLVPARNLVEISKSFGSDGQISLAIAPDGKDLIYFESTTKAISSVTVKGTIPALAPLFPTAERIDNFAVVAKEDLLEATRRAALILERDKSVKYEATKDQLILTAAGADSAEATEAIPVSHSGDDVTVALKPQFVLDALSGIDAEMVTMVFLKHERNPARPGPVQFTASVEKTELADFRYLLQPNLLAN
ncbi:MAG: polymerase subunit beta [Actinomycetota bacterium]